MTQQWKRPSRDVRKLYPDARRESQAFVLTGGGPKRLGCVYTLHHRASGKFKQFRTLRDVYAWVETLPMSEGARA